MGFAAYKILFNTWFYLGLIAAIITINYFWGKPFVVAKPSKFFLKHEKLIRKVMDIIIICLIIFMSLTMIYPIEMFLESLTDLNQTSDLTFESSIIPFELSILLISLIWYSGMAGFFLGLLSVFQKNIKKTKRIILLIISILPIFFTISLLLIWPDKNRWSTIQFGFTPSILCWFINGPAIILRQPWIKFMLSVMRKLRIISGEFAE